MYGYNELGEAVRLLEMARAACGLMEETQQADDDPARLRLLAGLHVLRRNACYSDAVWTQRPVDLLANLQLPDDGEGMNIEGFLPESADEARVPGLRGAYARLLCLEKLDCLMQHLHRMDDRLKWLETAGPDQLPVRLHAALAAGQSDLEHLLSEAERRRGERMRLDVFDQQISYPERIARAAGTRLGEEARVRIPGQCVENFGAHPELLLLLAVMYRRLKAQNVTRAQLQAGEDFWEIPGGAKGLGVYAPGITPDTFQARITRVLDVLGANAPVRIIKFNDVYMARLRPDVFEWFDKANENAASAADAACTAAELPVPQGDTDEARLMDAWRLYLEAKHARAQAQGEAQREEHSGHVDIVLADDGGYEAFAELENVCRARTQAKRPARRDEKQREGMFRLFAPDAEPTAQLWAETQPQRLEMAADAIRGWQALKAGKSFGKPFKLLNNYSAGWEERVKKLLLGYICACAEGDGFAADESGGLPDAVRTALTDAQGLKALCDYRARLGREELRLVIRRAGERTLFSLGAEDMPENGGLEEWIFREREQRSAPANARNDMRKWLSGGVIRFLQEDAEVVNRQKNKALDLKKRKQAAYNQTKALHLALSHWLTLRQKHDIEGCVVTLDSAGGIRLCDGRLSGGTLHAVEDGCVSTMEDMLDSMFAGDETGINAFLNRIVHNAEYRLVMRRQKKTGTESEYRAFLYAKGGAEAREL